MGKVKSLRPHLTPNISVGTAEQSLRCKGFTFIPSPKSYDANNILLRDFEEFARKLK